MVASEGDAPVAHAKTILGPTGELDHVAARGFFDQTIQSGDDTAADRRIEAP